MELRLLAAVDRDRPLSPASSSAIISLISNPCTSVSTLTSILETLNLHLQNPNCNHQQIFSLLSAVSHRHLGLRRRVEAAVRAFIILPSTTAPSLPHALSLLDPADLATLDLFSDESLFLSLCLYHCTKTREWMLSNVSRFRLRPSVLLTVLLGFTKDPYPYTREAALDGLVVVLNNGIVVEDRSLVGGCYFRATELLFDDEISVRRAALRVVSEWGQLLVALNPDESKIYWSDALFLQLCSMARDMDMEIRVTAFSALGKILSVSEDILLQSLSKKDSPKSEEKSYPGQYTAKISKIPSSAATFVFPRGLDDEYYQVRRSACCALQSLTVLSAKFSEPIVDILMDVLNDDSVIVRLQALETLHHMAMNDRLKVAEDHLHMFFSVLIDNDALIRSAVRKTLQLTKWKTLVMFRSCINHLVMNLELYPQEEADIFYALYRIGRLHGKFVVTITQEFSQELEPSFDGKLGFNKLRTAALLALAISAPVSLEHKICSIPPQIFSYAVTLLGRISSSLVEVADQNVLLSYLSQCSRFTFAPSSEDLEEGLMDFGLKHNHINLYRKSNDLSLLLTETVEPKKSITSLESYVKAMSCVKIVFQNIVNLWPLIQLGCMNEVAQTLRTWKKELIAFSCDSHQPAGVHVFAIKYIHIIKLLGNAWARSFSNRNLGVGALEILLIKMERRLKEMLYKYVGLSRGEKLHILELMLISYALRLLYGETFCFDGDTNKLQSVLRSVEHLRNEGSVETSLFVTELQNVSCETGLSEDEDVDKLDLLRKSLNGFSLKEVVLTREMKYIDGEVDVCNNDFLNPLPFVPGLPVGIPLEITLHNICSETKLWLAISLGEKSSTQFVFLDLNEFGGSDEMRKFKYVAPFFRAPRVKHFIVKVSIAMECSSDDQLLKPFNGSKHELVDLSRAKEVHLSMSVK